MIMAAFSGTPNSDVIFGGQDNDFIDGGDQADFINAGDGNDGVRGGKGNDVIFTGNGNDAALGEAGDDFIDTGAGDDVIDSDSAFQIFVLADNNILVSFDPNTPGVTQNIAITGLTGNLIGIDVRTADNQIYGLTTANQIYLIDPIQRTAKLVSTLNVPLQSGEVVTGFDFNPTPDRLRLITNQRNLRANIRTGEVNTDTPVAYNPNDPNAGKTPNIVGAAYTNNFPPSPFNNRPTTLYVLDANQDTLAVQGGVNFPLNPGSPNAGVLQTIGKLGVDIQDAGFEITTLPNGVQTAVYVANSTLYSVDLQSGKSTNIGKIGDGSLKLRGLAIRIGSDVSPGGQDQIFAGDGNDLINSGGGNDFIDAGAGNDIVIAGLGNDRLFGRSGNDVLQGDAGNDEIQGGDGDDILDGGDGLDILFGELGNDNLRGGYGNDVIDGGDGNDSLLGEAGNDILRGGAGSDSIDGDAFLRFYALGTNNTLIAAEPAQTFQPQVLQISGLGAGVSLVGLDRRPVDNQLYAFGSDNSIYTLDFLTGAATKVSTLNTPFFNAGDSLAGVGLDFNPVPDRLRLVNGGDKNFRINVDTGMVADGNPGLPGFQPDGTLAYVSGDANFGQNPNIVAVAYSNNIAGATTTTLFGLDATRDTLVRFDSPNAGTLVTVGALGVDIQDNTNFDILSNFTGLTNIAVAVSGNTLLQIDLTTGRATPLGSLGDPSANYSGFTIALVPDPTAPSDDQIFGGLGNDFLNGNLGNDVIYGEDGNDLILGGPGDDLLFGGAGADSFIFQSIRPYQAMDFGVDRIGDFNPMEDKIVLSQTSFGKLTPDSVDFVANDDLARGSTKSIVYSQGSGTLFFNPDGGVPGFAGGGAFAQINGNPLLSTNQLVFA
jgi:Ca2+-binding RTX toxin-like protein